jgi:Dockerin type I domain/PEP-CTERM motif
MVLRVENLGPAHLFAREIPKGAAAIGTSIRKSRITGALLRFAIALLVVMAHGYAIATPLPGPTVISFDVLFGSISYNLIGSSRTTLPWQITGIEVSFSEPITSGDLASLSGVSASSFSGLGTATLTWNFSALSNGNYSFVLAGSGIDALSGSSGALSGGIGFTQDFTVLYGDFNGDGQVNSADIAGVTAAAAEPYNIFADINGDGVVNATDASLIPVTTSIPEPSTVALLGAGLAGIGLARRKGQRLAA